MSIRNERYLNSNYVLLAALALRYLCHCVMLIPVLMHECRPAPSLPDIVLAQVPYMPFVARWNYVVWILCYMPPAGYLLYRNRNLFLRFLAVDGALALLRGLAIPLTGLGPVMGADINALHPFDLWDTWLALINPVNAIVGNTAGIYLTKDLFFSGHVASTFMLYLFSRNLGRASRVFLALHIVCLISVFASHLHYTIDVIGAYAITYCVYCFAMRVGIIKAGPQKVTEVDRQSASPTGVEPVSPA